MRQFRLLFIIFLLFIIIIFPTKVYGNINFIRNGINNININPGEYAVVRVITSDNTYSSATCQTPSNNASLKEDSVLFIEKFSNYSLAKAKMDSMTSSLNDVVSIVGFISNGEKTIVDSQYALLDFNTKGTNTLTTSIYDTPSGVGYFNGYYAYGPDGALLDININNERAKTKISGVTGWIDRFENGYTAYKIIPISSVKNASYYIVEDGVLYHQLVMDLTNYNCYNSRLALGVAPSFLEINTKYYSYDGHYFYKNLFDMLDDYKKTNTIKAVNYNFPYFNYYQFINFRTKTSYNETDLNSFVVSRGYGNSKLATTGIYFLNAQNKYYINMATSFGIAINESGWGLSNYAINRNNLFGLNAFDSNPNGATYFSSVEQSITEFFYHYMHYGYADFIWDTRAKGAFLGDKNQGANVKYASDPYWGEKAAYYYYNLDKTNGLTDYNKYQLGIKLNNVIMPLKKAPTNNSEVAYSIAPQYINYAFAIVEEVNGDLFNGSNIWYKVVSESNLDINKNYIPKTFNNINNNYNLENNYVYIHSSYLYKVGSPLNPTEVTYTKKTGTFYLEELKFNNNKLNFSGALVVDGIAYNVATTPQYDLILTNKNTNKVYIYNMDKWIVDKGFYNGAWFKKDGIDITDLAAGDYNIQVRARVDRYESIVTVNNVFSKEIVKKSKVDNKLFWFKTNYFDKNIPLELFVRENNIIDQSSMNNIYNKYVDYTIFEITNDNKLHIRGTAYNIDGNYATNQNVSRQIILENQTTFETYIHEAGYIDNGDYNIQLKVSDGKAKTRAWFDTYINLEDVVSKLPVGKYTIYVRTKTSDAYDINELSDVFQRNLTTKKTINEKEISLKFNASKRLRVEFEIK